MDLSYGTKEQHAEGARKQAEWEKATAEIRAEMEKIEAPAKKSAYSGPIKRFPEYLQEIMAKPESELTPLERQIAHLGWIQTKERGRAAWEGKIKGEVKKRYDVLKAELKKFDALKPRTLPPIMGVTDLGPEPPVVKIPKKDLVVEPTLPTAFGSPAADIRPTKTSTGRRAALARWLTKPDHPLTTRVIVNRIWQQRFGRGIVASVNDFGKQGVPPTHPDLLDWLARRFVKDGWSFRKFDRIIVTSGAYKRASVHEGGARAVASDPANGLLWRQRVRRLDSDQVRDAMLAVGGKLDTRVGGPAADENKARRSIWVKLVRNKRPELMEAFDGPDGFNSCAKRQTTTTATQALLLINGDWTLARARELADRAGKSKDPVGEAYRLVYGRNPLKQERGEAEMFLRVSAEPVAPPKPPAPIVKAMPNREGQAAELSGKALTVPNHASFPSGDFTVEAVVLLRSLYKDATVRTIAAQWDGHKEHPGWALGVSSTKSQHQPLNLILQLVGHPAKGDGGYEVIASNLRVKLNTPYYVAASIRIGDKTKDGITFYAKELSEGGMLETAKMAHRVGGHYRSDAPLTIGGRAGNRRHFWDGLVDDVRISASALDLKGLLIEGGKADSVGFWRFEKDFHRDASGRGNDIAREKAPRMPDPRRQALADLCHVLLNSNEFLYVD